MISPQIVAEVRRLLAEEKHSHRKIARLTGISRGSVGAIASGRRPDYEPLREEDEEEEPAGPPRRCPNCGGLVYVPCRLCRVRKTHGREAGVRRRGADGGDRTSRWSWISDPSIARASRKYVLGGGNRTT